MKDWFRKGSPWIWLSGGAVTISMVMVVGLVAMIAVKGLSHFWPKPVVEFDYQCSEQSEPVRVIGDIRRSESTTAAAMREAGFNIAEDQDVVVRHLVKRGNRDVTGQDFVWFMESFMSDPRYPEEILVLERLQWGDRKSTRLNSSHVASSYAVFCL